MLELFKYGVAQPAFQKQLTRLFYGCAMIWAILCVIAALMLRDQILYFFFPFLGYNGPKCGKRKAPAWRRSAAGRS